MNIIEFTEKFAGQFEETPIDKFEPSTCFRELEEWDSMAALSVMAMFDEKYKVKLSPKELKQANTIQNLFDLLNDKK